MSQLIRSHKAVTIMPCSIPPTPTSATTALAKKEPKPVNPASASSASSVALPVSPRHGDRRPRTPNTTSASTTDAFGSNMKNTQGTCHQLKTAKVTRMTNKSITVRYDNRHRAAPTTEQHSVLAHDIGHVMNYNFNDINDDMLAYVNRLFAEQYKQLKSDLHQYFETFDDPQVALEEGCSKEFEDREDNWVWLCSHFQGPSYVNKAKANKSCQEKKTILHHSSSRLFSYKMKARRQHAQNFAPSTSEPVPNPETFLPQDFQPNSNDDPVDYTTLFS
ncbi:hypothetical protein D8674_031330 [Pyrus ussuriensis x Pyrus communis]|uniref:Uncharacterized protein n=1 Tax=Pyrus ussuriensis x Pyrus communis TaxID=2448454 RepID=A0A5N5F3V2_9ROSA|nr:hypothetical protein D8674_031330 [Pyrus ussuriensis x Pyrus communis]